MKIYFRLLLVTSIVASLSGCMFGGESGTTTLLNPPTKEKLADGSYTLAAYQKPNYSLQCTQLAEQKHNWIAEEARSYSKGHADRYGYLKLQAVAYANQVHLKPNYIFVYVPKQYSLDGIPLSAFSKATATFYYCKKLVIS